MILNYDWITCDLIIELGDSLGNSEVDLKRLLRCPRPKLFPQNPIDLKESKHQIDNEMESKRLS